MEEKEQMLISDEMSLRIVETAEKIAISSGAEKVTVRKILQALEITNRVFYNRFHNIEEVLKIVYENMVLKIRESITAKFSPDGDFFEQVIEIVANTLVMSYDIKMNFNYYIFENDSVSRGNYEWWKAEIKRLIEFGKARGYIKDVNTEAMSYAIWCFIRGYNADALGRKLPKEEAVENFKYCFGVLLDGMKA
ncbi:MAG: TetR/AcrR family transcriptional regulator [Clostridia bacterium]|nr:TetR/AcrR family transcriptional regulator [Clostridia bacterium]